MLTRNRDELLSRATELVARHMGLHFPRERYEDLERGLCAAVPDLGFQNIESCLESLVSCALTRSQIEILASHLTIGETYFFRESAAFQTLEEYILPELVRQRRGNNQQLRIWTAGCASGEEPYSVAILLQKVIRNIDDWNISVLATDINPQALKTARLGIYNNWSFRDCPVTVKDKYFTLRKNGQSEISPEIRRMVTFVYHNLALDPYPSLANNTNAMDVILCRNVLMYFNRDAADMVLSNFNKCLVEGGWLMVSPCDIPQGSNPGLRHISHSGAILYRKDGQLSSDVQAAISGETRFYPLTENPPVVFESFLPVLTGNAAETNIPTETPVPMEVHKEKLKHELPLESPYQQALTFFKQGSYARAEKVIGSVLKKNVDAKMMILSARICANQGLLEAALLQCQKSIELDKSNPSSRYLLANIMQELGRVQEATMALKQTIYLDPNFVLAYFTMGNLALKQGDTRKSLKHFENALAILNTCTRDDMLADEGDISAGRMAEIIRSTIGTEKTI